MSFNFFKPGATCEYIIGFRLALALAFGVTLSACSSTPPDQILPIKPRRHRLAPHSVGK